MFEIEYEIDDLVESVVDRIGLSDAEISCNLLAQKWNDGWKIHE